MIARTSCPKQVRGCWSPGTYWRQEGAVLLPHHLLSNPQSSKSRQFTLTSRQFPHVIVVFCLSSRRRHAGATLPLEMTFHLEFGGVGGEAAL